MNSRRFGRMPDGQISIGFKVIYKAILNILPTVNNAPPLD